ncbi:MAG TPA: cupredoxin domain-containing protein [Acidimicrobiales bacterium]|nr:cupredoxin domain-containing protein [Acidimicrobiales bacterium]
MRRLLVAAVVAAVLLAGCGDDDDTETAGTATTAHADGHDHGTGGGEPTCEPSGTSLEIVASDTRFDKDCLAVPAGDLFTITYRNNDSLPHSLVFLRTHTSNETLFEGADVFTGPRTVTVNGPALEAGNYAFHCTVHPAIMKGSFIVK